MKTSTVMWKQPTWQRLIMEAEPSQHKQIIGYAATMPHHYKSFLH